MIRPFGDGRDRYFTERLGLFVHWGLYAIPAWHEQILWRSDMRRRDYEQLIHRFNPERFDPDEWLAAAESAGMSFVLITTKHHDGFCLWDTRLTDYSVMRTPYGRDILAELAAACERRGIALGFYYSCPDWHHPQYPNLGRHHEMFGPRRGDRPDLAAYWEFVRGQVRELCTNYGPLRDFFWDVNVAEHHDPSLNDMVRELQPGILINDRGPGPGDYGTPERHVPDAREFDAPTQAVQALGRESWGYRSDEDYYSDRYVIESIDRVLAMGGDYILNVGPKADGSLPEENVRTLARVGDWYRRVREAFDGTAPASTVIDDDAIGMDDGPRVHRDSMLVTRTRQHAVRPPADGAAEHRSDPQAVAGRTRTGDAAQRRQRAARHGGNDAVALAGAALSAPERPAGQPHDRHRDGHPPRFRRRRGRLAPASPPASCSTAAVSAD